MSNKSLKHQTVTGMVWSSVQRFGSMGISFIANLFLVRLLMPEDFGSIGILMVFIAIANLFVDAGFGAALIQKKTPTNNDYSTIFYLNLIISVVLYLVFYFTAPVISRFYQINELSDLLRVLSLILIFNSFSIIQENQLRKQLKFKKLSIVSLISALLAAICGITLAYLGFGVWSLVVNGLVNSFLKSVLLWILNKWHPVLVFSKQSLKELFSFGGFILANGLLFTLRKNIQALVIGKIFTTRDLGFYTQARKLEEIPSTSFANIVDQVSFPVFSKLQDNKVQLVNALQKSLKSLAFISFPLIILLIVIANSLITILFTDKWAESVPYFQILCVGALASCLQAANANVVNALGKSAIYFRFSVIKTLVLFVFIAVGSVFGIKGLLYGCVIGSWFDYFINAWLVTRFTHYKILHQLKDIFPIFIISIVVGIATWFFGNYLINNNFVEMILQVFIYIIIYLGLSYFLKIDICVSLFKMAKKYIYIHN